MFKDVETAVSGHFNKTHHLDREYGENAGHRIEQNASKKGKQQGPELVLAFP